jgi:hypothetical protein
MVSFLRFQIRHPTGQVEHLNVEGERVLIGSGAHCEIRLPIDQAAVESVLIQRSPAGVYAQALSFDPAPTINNAPFSQAPLQPESALGIGTVQIFVAISEGGAHGEAIIAKKQNKTSPLTLVLAAICALAAAYYFLLQDEDKGPTSQPTQVPDLWDAPAAACPQNAPEQAMARARESAAVADARRERRPFHVQDGVAAVPLYELASVCFRQGGDQGAAAESANRAAGLRAEMQQDFRTHRVRLDHLLAVKDWVAARREVRTLLAYMEGKSGDYVTWLSNLDRNLKLKVGRVT